MRSLAFLLPWFTVAVAVADAGWTVQTVRRSTDASGRVGFSQMDARSDVGATATLTVAQGPQEQLRWRVVAQTLSPFSSVRDAVETHGAVAGVNGGYFDPDGQPVGWRVVDGHQLQAFSRAKLLSGVAIVRGDRLRLERAAHGRTAANLPEAAIQCGPLLVERRRPVPGLNANRSAPRTFVFVTRGGAAGIGVARSLTLAELGELLATPGATGHEEPVETALNLDGGSSTAFYARGTHQAWDDPGWARVSDCLTLGVR